MTGDESRNTKPGEGDATAVVVRVGSANGVLARPPGSDANRTVAAGNVVATEMFPEDA